MLDKITVKELAQYFECPVCYQYLQSVSFVQCQNGHSGCITCYSKLSTCPMCRLQLKIKTKTISDEMMATIYRELRHVEDVDGAIRLTDLLKFFKCSNCKFCPTRQPVWQCENGHLICKDCDSYELNQCKTCEVSTYDIKSRGILVQKILELSGKPCRFAIHGCKAIIRELSEHEKADCSYRKVRCIFADCLKEMSMVDMMAHLSIFNANHSDLKLPPIIVKQNRKQGRVFLPAYWNEENPTVNRELNRIQFFKLENFNLFFVRWANNLRKTCYFWVSVLGPPNEAKKFGFRLRLFKNESEKEIQISGPAVSVVIPYRPMIHHPLSFKISFVEVIEFWNQENIHFNWEITIIKSTSQMNEIISTKSS